MLRKILLVSALGTGLAACGKDTALLPTESPSVETAPVALTKTWTAVDLGGAGARIVYGINDHDKMVGESDTDDGIAHAGTVDRNGVWQDFPALPGYPNSYAFSVNNQGIAAGGVNSLDYSAQKVAVWLPDGTIITPLRGPSTSSVLVEEISDAAVVIGFVQLAPSNVIRAFHWKVGGELKPLAGLTPGSESAAYGINTQGVVVGTSMSGGQILPVRWEASGHIRAIPLPPGFTSGLARSINDRGEVAGYSIGGRAWRWSEARGPELLDLLPGATGSGALTIDARGRIFGTMTLSDGTRHPIVWIGTAPTLLPDLGGPTNSIWGANRCGRAVGNEPTHMVLYDTTC